MTARVTIPALVRGDELITDTGLFGRFTRRAAALEASAGGLAAGILISNPFTDVPELQTSVFVTTDADPDAGGAARRSPWRPASGRSTSGCSSRSSRSRRPSTLAHATTRRDGHPDRRRRRDELGRVGRQQRDPARPRRRRLPRARSWRRSSMPVRSPRRGGRAWAARLRTTIGGRLDPARFDADAVRGQRGRARATAASRASPTASSGGRARRRSSKNETLTIVATSRPVMLYDRSLFLAHGQDPRDFDAVVVKSPHCEPRFFATGRPGSIDVDAPGVDQREPAQPRPRPLPATDLPARRRRPVHARRRAVLAAAVRRPAGVASARPVGAPVRIREIVAVGLYGATPEGGWSQELRPEDSVHTLVAVVTEEGPVGYGSAFTNVDLVRAALAQLEPLYRGASAIEPERTSEILHQNTFWLGSRRDADPRDQRHRHRAVGPARPGDRPAGRPAARRPVPRAGPAVRLDPDARAGSAGRRARPAAGPGLPRVQARLGPVRAGERRAWTRRSSRAHARRSGRTSR